MTCKVNPRACRFFSQYPRQVGALRALLPSSPHQDPCLTRANPQGYSENGIANRSAAGRRTAPSSSLC